MANGDVVFRRQGRTIVVCRHGERKHRCPICGPPLPPPPVPPMRTFHPTPIARDVARVARDPIANIRAAAAMFKRDPWRPFGG